MAVVCLGAKAHQQATNLPALIISLSLRLSSRERLIVSGKPVGLRTIKCCFNPLSYLVF